MERIRKNKPQTDNSTQRIEIRMWNEKAIFMFKNQFPLLQRVALSSTIWCRFFFYCVYSTSIFRRLFILYSCALFGWFVFAVFDTSTSKRNHSHLTIFVILEETNAANDVFYMDMFE